jgi:large subunit ribosomal protein L6
MVLKSVNIQGTLGSICAPFWGFDILFRPSKLFLFSTGSFSTLLSLLTKTVVALESGIFVELLLVGLGFRLIRLGSTLLLKLGYAHYIKILIPSTIYLVGYKKRLLIFGVSSAVVKQFSSNLISFRRPDVYKSKGIQLVGNSFRVKIGKQK